MTGLARARGHEVVFTGRDKDRIEAVAHATGARGCQADVSVDTDIAETVMAALSMRTRTPWPEVAVFATNPWKED